MNVDHIAFKTNAWKNPDMVKGYVKNVTDMSGVNLMKNHIEVALFQRYAQDKEILDVGIGTGRASIPLAKLGYNITGVDSSEAMLQQCRELAGDSPMDLVLGDVASLPFRDELFDTVMALNTIAHFPHWRDIVVEWARVLRPGGRMIFDLFSMDHDTEYARAVGRPAQWGRDTFAPPSAQAYYLRLPVNELVEQLAPMGLCVEAIVPYSVFFGTKGFNRFFEGSILSGFAWDRLLSWVSADKRLFEFFAFLEQEFVGRLTSVSACRYMAVLKKADDEAANVRWLERNAQYNDALRAGLSLRTVASFSDLREADFTSKLREMLKHPPNRFALARILSASIRWSWKIALEEFLEDDDRIHLQRVLELAKLDADVTAMLQNLHRDPRVSQEFTYKGVPMGGTIEYTGMIAILDEAFGAFTDQVLCEERP